MPYGIPLVPEKAPMKGFPGRDRPIEEAGKALIKAPYGIPLVPEKAPAGVPEEMWAKATLEGKIAWMQDVGLFPPGTAARNEATIRARFLQVFPEAAGLSTEALQAIMGLRPYPQAMTDDPREYVIKLGGAMGNVGVLDMVAWLSSEEGSQRFATMPDWERSQIFGQTWQAPTTGMEQLTPGPGVSLKSLPTEEGYLGLLKKPVSQVPVGDEGYKQVYTYPQLGKELGRMGPPLRGLQFPSSREGQEALLRTRYPSLFPPPLFTPLEEEEEVRKPKRPSWSRLTPPARWLTF